MDLQLRGKTAFITGSTAGIGFGAAQAFLREGAGVYLNGRTSDSVDQAIQRLRAEFPHAEIGGFATDFSQPEEVDGLLARLPKIDILLNNVGIYAAQSFFDTTDADWYRQFEVNVMSGVRLSRSLLPKMLERGQGRILFVSSECATLVPPDLIAYSMTKTALLAISRGLAQLTAGTPVTVNAVIPGSTMTEGAEQFLANLAEQEGKSPKQAEADFFAEVRTSSLLQRFARVEEVANAIVYYASPLAAATNGAAIKLEGGSMGGIL